jgi:hypothetical protein
MPNTDISTLIPNIEPISSEPNSKTERMPAKEVAPALSPTSTPAPATPPNNATKKTAFKKTNGTKTPNVINKTKEPEILHPVDPNADTLTTIADKEEEKFIKEVIKEHQDGTK